MSYTREIVILANSAKKGGYCVAGKDIRTGEWIRPVSTFSGGELSREQVTLNTGKYSYLGKPLHKAQIDFMTHAPLSNQPENHLITNSKWKPAFKMDRSNLSRLVDEPEDIWMYGHHQDRVNYSVFEHGLIDDHQSLYLIHVDSITYKVILNGGGYQRLKGTFEYNDQEYSFNVTDPEYCKYKNGPLGDTFTEFDKYLCLSLGEKFEPTGQCYKLIASII